MVFIEVFRPLPGKLYDIFDLPWLYWSIMAHTFLSGLGKISIQQRPVNLMELGKLIGESSRPGAVDRIIRVQHIITRANIAAYFLWTIRKTVCFGRFF